MADLWQIYGRSNGRSNGRPMADLCQIYGRPMADLWQIYGSLLCGSNISQPYIHTFEYTLAQGAPEPFMKK